MNFLRGIYLPNILKGNIRTAPINLNTSSSVSPTILNGNKISHKIGRIKTNANATGQHITNRMHQSKMAITDLIDLTNGNNFQLLYFHF